jgi:DNA-binding CsgD family transcriptional regulator
MPKQPRKKYGINKLYRSHILTLILFGTDLDYKAIAKILGLSVRTVHSHRDLMFRYFKVTSRVALVVTGLKQSKIILSDIPTISKKDLENTPALTNLILQPLLNQYRTKKQ